MNWDEMKREKNGLMIFGGLAGVLTIFGFFMPFIVAAAGGIPNMAWLLALIPAAILWLFFYKRYQQFRTSYKTLVVDRAAQGMFDKYSYYPKVGFDREEIRATGIMSMGNRYNSEDLVEGSYKGVTFRRADMYIAQHTSTGKSSHTTIYLRGSWLCFSYNKSFNSDLQIISKDFSFSNKRTSRLFTRKEDRRHTFETEDVEFNKMFTCTCQTDTEAFYLLTPRIIQMLKLLRTEFGCPFMLGFVDNKLHFAIKSGKNHMEPPVLGSLNPDKEVETTRRELKTICNIIDSLSIDRDIYKEESDW